MLQTSKRIFKNGKYSTFLNNVSYYYPDVEEIQYVLGDGPQKEMRKLKLNMILNNSQRFVDISNQYIKGMDELVMNERNFSSLLKEDIEMLNQKVDKLYKQLQEKNEEIFQQKDVHTVGFSYEDQLERMNAKYLDLKKEFSVRGAINLIREEIHRDYESVYWSNRWDKTTQILLSDKKFMAILTKYAKDLYLDLKAVEEELEDIYEILLENSEDMRSIHDIDHLIIDTSNFTSCELAILISLFERFKIPFFCRNKEGNLFKNPFQKS